MLRLQYERIVRRLTQLQLAKLAGLNQGTISLIECGRLQPTDRELNALARVLHVRPPAALLIPVRVVEPIEGSVEQAEPATEPAGVRA